MKPIQKTSASQQVMNYILDCIDKGELKQGDRLPGEREFAASLGISRVPLREAISALSAIGIVEKRHGDGNFIAAFSSTVLGRVLRTYSILDHRLADDLFEARFVVESATASLAARNALPEDVARIQADLDRMEAAIPLYVQGKLRLEDMLQLDDLFHLGCAAAAHNQFYIQFIDIIHNVGADMGLYEKTYGQHPEHYDASLKAHRLVLAAIAAGDERQAYELMRRHIKAIQSDIEKNDT